MSGEVLYSSVKFTRKPGHQAAAKLCAGREDYVTYATVKFAEAPNSQQQQQTDPSRTAVSLVYCVLYPELCSLSSDPTPPVSAAGKASSYRQPALVLLILCCLLLAAIISLAVYHFRTKEDPEKYTSLSTNYSSLLNQLQDLSSDYSNLNRNHSELQSNYSKLSGSHSELQSNYSRLNETHSDLQSNYIKLSGSHSNLQSNYSRLNETHSELQSNYSRLNETHSELQSNYSRLNETHSELQSNYSRLQKENSALKKHSTELSVKSILDKYCPLKEGSSKERVCKACPEKWVESNGKCYYFSPDKMNWNSSRASCVSMGADLVIIESEAEQKFLLENDKSKPLLGNAEKNSYWIGLTDAATEGTWLWVDGTPLNDKAKYWHGNEPDDWKGEDSSGEDCARLAYLTSPANSLKAWFDASCTRQQHRRICETTALINI
ncbi:C-type lectin domain family 4 member M-like [Acipenser ruthenus]|uniref:C-type lectin domain family 4 member M-like n=1 Tax=Acipenser ruthenus TaxID=7906 RepID=UPI002741E00C|nr:C-type lectin domain family 4 member M-like [Acipenser ruthenus]